MKPGPFDPLRVLETLARQGVRYVVIGGFAGRLWGSTTVTNDLDVCYARDRKNLESLSRALRELHATVRGAPEDLPVPPDPETLASGDPFKFATTAGNVGCLATPVGSQGFSDLIAGAAEMTIGSLRVPVAAVEDLIRSKRAAGRPTDRAELEILSALKEEIERSSP
ncbi:MAG TPA: hypothetical protein VN971_11680 [Thermoanaerobaculia bacterium]|nr:hypothetical protein [Thermoanaerobaculia bacterium]